jgi:hypothetical protein
LFPSPSTVKDLSPDQFTAPNLSPDGSPSSRGSQSQISSRKRKGHSISTARTDKSRGLDGRSRLGSKLKGIFVSKPSPNPPPLKSSHGIPTAQLSPSVSLPPSLPTIQPFIWPAIHQAQATAPQLTAASGGVPLSESALKSQQPQRQYTGAAATQAPTPSSASLSPRYRQGSAFRSRHPISQRGMEPASAISGITSSTNSDYADVPSRLPYHSPGYSPGYGY